MTKVQITSGMNGYPQNIREGQVFDHLNEIKDFDNVVLLKKRDGWHFWENLGYIFKPLTVFDYVNDLGDNYNIENEESISEIMIEMIQESENTDEKIELLNNFAEILLEIKQAKPDQSVICNAGKYFETVDNEMVSYHQDVWTYNLGIEKEVEK